MRTANFWSCLFLVSPLVLPVVSLPAASLKRHRPLVVWHGLGDKWNSDGMMEFADLVEQKYPGIYVHSVYMNEDSSEDEKASWLGNVNEQVEFAAKELKAVKELEDGFDAVGFSQGGQFLRAYAERFNDPPMRNLVTFGSQHMGISDIPPCATFDFLCQLARRLVKGEVYSDWAQKNSVQAQYFRDPANLAEYYRANTFLPSVNNEIPSERNATYKENLASLETLILIMFTEDTTVVPKESSWFGSEVMVDEPDYYGGIDQEPLARAKADEKVLVPMRDHPLYTEDWIGLKQLDEAGKIVFEKCIGAHMQVTDCWEKFVDKYVGVVLD